MKRTAIRRKTPLRQRRREGADIVREPHPQALAATMKPLRRGTYAGSTSGAAVVKPEPLRDQALRDMAQNRPCMFLVPAICNARQDTTVLCHENQGKGMGTKQSDERAAWGCIACHRWYDTGTAPREQKRQAFMEAHLRQVLAYRVVATDTVEPDRFRRAARRALEALGATPIGEAAC